MTREPPIDWDALLEDAKRARGHAHAPYSAFRVGATLLAEDGRTFTGANVENASHGLAICAERAAIAHAVTEGARRFRALAIVTGAREPATPCGMCRQTLVEFPPSFPVRSYAADGRFAEHTVEQLLPDPFRL